MVSSLPVSDQKIDRCLGKHLAVNLFCYVNHALCGVCSERHLWKNEKSHFWHPGLSVHDDENLTKGHDEAAAEKEEEIQRKFQKPDAERKKIQ